MIRIVAGAVTAALAAAVILVQMQGTAELAFWEILLLVLVVFQYRGIPDRGDPIEEPLFDLRSPEPDRLPRSIAISELAVIDATTDYLSPNRRLRPALRRIAEHRLRRHGHGLDGPDALEALGEAEWETLMGTGETPMTLEELERLVGRLEEL